MIEETKFFFLAFLAAFAVFGYSDGAIAAEGGSSLYIPGGAGDAVIALSPEPGLQIANGLYTQIANVDTAVLQGAVDVGIDVVVVLNFFGMSYTVKNTVLGGTYTFGAVIPFGYASIEAEATGFGNGASIRDNSVNIADALFVPLQLNWSVGNFHFKFAEGIIAPTGDYDVDDLVNLGRNYWAFDTIAALTWLNPEIGLDISIAPGILLNTPNDDTDYKTGSEFHVDFTVNQFFAKNFAIGIRGYYYRQLSGDSGTGARLGDFKGESLGIGPGFLWQPEAVGGKLSIVAKVMFDVTATNRLKSTYGTLGAAWKF